MEGEFDIPHVSHGFMELQSIIADYKKDGTVEVWTSTQSPFSTRYLMALSLGIPINRVVIKAPLCGGGFGGKVGIGWEPLVALLSKKVGRPVKLVLSRKEQFCSAPVREGFHASVKAGFKKDGKLFAYKARFVMDAAVMGIIRSMFVERLVTHRRDATRSQTSTANHSQSTRTKCPQVR